jgi:hypothetical protein
MNPVRFNSETDVHAIVDEKAGAIGAGKLTKLISKFKQRASLDFFFAELNRFDSGLESFFDNRHKRSVACLEAIRGQVQIKINT